MTCDHGYESPHCPRTGCPSSRPAVRLEDWMRAERDTREPSMDIEPRRIPVAPLSDEERKERERLGREKARHLDELARRDNASGVISPGKVFVGVQENGRKAKGARAWWWQGPLVWVRGNKSSRCCCGDPRPHLCRVAQPTHVPGAPEDSSGYAQRVIRDITEAAAQREILRREGREAGTATLGLNPAQLSRRMNGRKHRRAG